MRFSKPIEIPCVFDSRSKVQLEELGVKSDEKSYDKPIYFYSIDTIRMSEFDDIEGDATIISSGGETFVTRMHSDKVIAKIQSVINN